MTINPRPEEPQPLPSSRHTQAGLPQSSSRWRARRCPPTPSRAPSPADPSTSGGRRREASSLVAVRTFRKCPFQTVGVVLYRHLYVYHMGLWSCTCTGCGPVRVRVVDVVGVRCPVSVCSVLSYPKAVCSDAEAGVNAIFVHHHRFPSCRKNVLTCQRCCVSGGGDVVGGGAWQDGRAT